MKPAGNESAANLVAAEMLNIQRENKGGENVALKMPLLGTGASEANNDLKKALTSPNATSAVVSQCGGAAVSRCSRAAVSRCGRAMVSQYGGAAMSRCSRAAVSRCGGAAALSRRARLLEVAGVESGDGGQSKKRS